MPSAGPRVPGAFRAYKVEGTILLLKMDKTKLLENIQQFLAIKRNEKAYWSNDIYKELLDFCRVICHDYAINIKYENYTTEVNKLRILFSKDRESNDLYEGVIDIEANGLIISVSNKFTAEIVCVPSYVLQSEFDNINLANKIIRGSYKVYKIKDGSTFNVYYYDSMDDPGGVIKSDNWVFSSKNSIDLTNFRWRGEDFQSLALKALTSAGQSLDKLIPGRTYTFGFKNPKIHLYNDATESCWFIQAYDSEKQTMIFDCDEVCVPSQTPENVDCIESETYTKSLLEQHEQKFLGYVAIPVKTHDLSSSEYNNPAIIIPSELWITVREMLYNGINNYVAKPRERYYSPRYITDMRYVLLKNYLYEKHIFRHNTIKESMFLKLFPEFKSDYEKFDIQFREIVEILYNMVYNYVKENPRGYKQSKNEPRSYPVINTNNALTSEDINEVIAKLVFESNGLKPQFVSVLKTRGANSEKSVGLPIIKDYVYNPGNLRNYSLILYRDVENFKL